MPNIFNFLEVMQRCIKACEAATKDLGMEHGLDCPFGGPSAEPEELEEPDEKDAEYIVELATPGWL